MFWEILQNIQCCQSRHGNISDEWPTSMPGCRRPQGAAQKLKEGGISLFPMRPTVPTVSTITCPRWTLLWLDHLCVDVVRYSACRAQPPSVIFPVVFLAEECVESEMTQLEESSFIWRERRQSLTLNMLLREKRGRESYDRCLFVDCWHVVVSDMNPVPRWRWIPGDPYERKPPLYIRVLDPLTPLQNICMSTHEGLQGNIRRQNSGPKYWGQNVRGTLPG